MDVIVYPTENHYDTLYEMFQGIKFVKKKHGGMDNRLGFPEHRGGLFGMVRPKFPKTKNPVPLLSMYSRKYPKVYEEIQRIGKLIVPFEYKAVQVNHNLECPPHRDKNNKSRSVLVSFGEYTGGDIVIEGIEYNAYHTPIEFDGCKMTHWNKPIHGNKYSLVYFS